MSVKLSRITTDKNIKNEKLCGLLKFLLKSIITVGIVNVAKDHFLAIK